MPGRLEREMGKAQCHHGASTQLSARAVINSSTLEQEPDDWPWGHGCDTDRQGPPCSILSTSVSLSQEGRRPMHWSTDRRRKQLEVMIHAGTEQHRGLAGLASEW